MNIGFDFDKVFIDYPPLIPNWLIDKLYKERDNGVLSYRIPGKLEQKFRQLTHLPPLRQPIKKNLAELIALAQSQKYALYLISSRFGFLKKQTERLTKKHSLENIFKEMYFNFQNEQPHIFKSRIVKELHIDRYIDDDLSLLKFLAKDNPRTMFYWLNNFTREKILDNLIGATSIDDVSK